MLTVMLLGISTLFWKSAHTFVPVCAMERAKNLKENNRNYCNSTHLQVWRDGIARCGWKVRSAPFFFFYGEIELLAEQRHPLYDKLERL